MTKNKLITVIGTTASGKSSLGIELADHYGGEIVSADSRQIYRKMDLGTGKITPEEGARVKHHLIDILDAGEPFSMADFQGLAYEAIDGIISRGKLPFLVGGTGLYSRSVVEGYNLSDVAPSEELPSRECVGRVLASSHLSCPPAIPIAIPGERLSEEAVSAMLYYGIDTCKIIK